MSGTRAGGEAFPVRVSPRAARAEIAGMRAGALHVRVTAAPEAGRANDALRRLIARRLGVPAGDVAIVRGERSREKLVAVRGLSRSEAMRLLLAEQ